MDMYVLLLVSKPLTFLSQVVKQVVGQVAKSIYSSIDYFICVVPVSALAPDS